MDNIFQVSPNGQTDSISKAESIVVQYLDRNPTLKIYEGPTDPDVLAQYSRERDHVVIRSPYDPEFNGSMDQWYRTLFHELTHSTGPRLDRHMGYRRNDFGYNLEEMIAELGSSFITEEVGITSTRFIHADYIKRYAYAVHADPQLLAHAVRQAREASDLILGRESEAAAAASRLIAA